MQQLFIRAAMQQDLNGIMEIVSESITLMREAGNTQWDETYPAKEDFAQDIREETLYVCDLEGKVGGVICLNEVEPDEYGPIAWTRNGPALVIHRMAVASWTRRRGVGTALLQWAGRLAAGKGYHCVKTDTYSQNPAMNTLFRKNGYERVGELYFKGKTQHFNCYEKCLL